MGELLPGAVVNLSIDSRENEAALSSVRYLNVVGVNNFDYITLLSRQKSEVRLRRYISHRAALASEN